MASRKKRPKKPNFTTQELGVMMNEIVSKAVILMSEKCNAVTNTRKQEIWENITRLVNTVGGYERTVEQVRKRWKDLKHACMVKWQGNNGDGGDSPQPKLPFEDKVLSVVRLALGESIPEPEENETWEGKCIYSDKNDAEETETWEEECIFSDKNDAPDCSFDAIEVVLDDGTVQTMDVAAPADLKKEEPDINGQTSPSGTSLPSSCSLPSSSAKNSGIEQADAASYTSLPSPSWLPTSAAVRSRIVQADVLEESAKGDNNKNSTGDSDELVNLCLRSEIRKNRLKMRLMREKHAAVMRQRRERHKMELRLMREQIALVQMQKREIALKRGTARFSL